MTAVALAIGGGGALSSIETTVLMTADETIDALRKAGDVQYQKPGAQIERWAHLGSNQGPPACEAGALPLSYAPRAVEV